MAQYHQIQQIPGVQVAAPIAMVGYSLLVSNLSFPLPAADYARPGRQLYRVEHDVGQRRRLQHASGSLPPISTSRRTRSRERQHDWRNAGGASRRIDRDRMRPPAGAADTRSVRRRRSVDLRCAGPRSTVCGPGSGYSQPANPGFYVSWTLPVLIAAIDPAAEAKLDGLNHAVISGHYLSGTARRTGRQAPTVSSAVPCPGCPRAAAWTSTPSTQLQQLRVAQGSASR